MTLDELARQYPQGKTIWFKVMHFEGKPKLATVVGVTWGLPLEAGGPDEPNIVIRDRDDRIGLIYPQEVVEKP
jgi:hypothetical protein